MREEEGGDVRGRAKAWYTLGLVMVAGCHSGKEGPSYGEEGWKSSRTRSLYCRLLGWRLESVGGVREGELEDSERESEVHSVTECILLWRPSRSCHLLIAWCLLAHRGLRCLLGDVDRGKSKGEGEVLRRCESLVG